MKELQEIAVEYAANKTNETITNAIAQAYADGYRDGYKDREEEIPVDFRDTKIEYVDLGLPSGTLWAVDYVMIEGKRSYLPYIKAKEMAIPTEEQWNELVENCQWSIDSYKGIKFIGVNGNIIKFRYAGYVRDNKVIRGSGCFWINNEEEKEKHGKKNMVRFYKNNMEVSEEFSGYKLPIRLVKIK